MANFLATTGHYPKAWNAKKSDLISYALRNTRFDVEAEYARLIGEGYTVYDICAEGGLTYLSSKAAGKYLCLYLSLLPAYLDTPETGTATAGAATTITLAAGASAADDYYNGMVIQLTGGTGSGQYNIITDYNGTTKVATVKTWATNPASGTTYKIGGYDYIVADQDVTIHTDVRILGIKINVTTYKIETINQTIKFICEYSTSAHREFNDKLTLSFVKVYFGTNRSDGWNTGHYYISFNNCELHLMDYTEVLDMDVFDSNIVYFEGITSNALSGLNRDTLVSNCQIIISNSGTLGKITIQNCEVIGLLSSTLVQFGNSPAGVFCIAENIYCENIKVRHFVESSGILYVKNCTIDWAFGGILLRSAHLDRQWFIPRDSTPPVLNTAASGGLMDSANYQSLNVTISSSLELVSYAGNDYSFRYYELSFTDTGIVGDDFKTMFAKEQSNLVVWRDDLDEEFVNAAGGALKINNLALFENDGATLYDYRNNENFFLLAEDADGNECVFCWYQGMVYPTAFHDFWDDTEYTIKRCFQILEPPDKITWRNKINEYLDSPIEGSGSFKDLTWYYCDDR